MLRCGKVVNQKYVIRRDSCTRICKHSSRICQVREGHGSVTGGGRAKGGEGKAVHAKNKW